MTPATLDPPFVWHVPSVSGEVPYLCDLSANHGLGQCTCRHHTCKRQPAIDSRLSVLPKPCRHVEVARAAAEELFYAALIKREGLPDLPQFRGIGRYLFEIALHHETQEQ